MPEPSDVPPIVLDAIASINRGQHSDGTPHGTNASPDFAHARRWLSRVEAIAEGARNDTLNQKAFAVARLFSLSEQEHRDLLMDLNQRFQPPLSDTEALPTIASGWRAGLNRRKEEAAMHVTPATALPDLVPADNCNSGSLTIGQILQSPAMVTRVERLSTGFPELDRALDDGFVPGGLYVVAGATSRGKSTLAQNSARRVALNGTPTLFVTLEDPLTQVVRKCLAASAHVPVRSIERLQLTAIQYNSIQNSIQALSSIPLWFSELAELGRLENLIRGHSRNGVKVAFIDQMSWISAQQAEPYERAVLISKRLKQLAAETGVVLVLLCQVNREGARRKDGPELFDLRDSGTIEQDADGVLLIKSAELGAETNCATVRLEVAKHRHGPRGLSVELHWFLDQGRIESIESPARGGLFR